MENTYDLLLNYKEDSYLNSYYINNDLTNPIKYFYNFNTINIFVGANNSGKSRFMREIINFNSLTGINRIDDTLILKEKHNELVDLLSFNITINVSTFVQYIPMDKRRLLADNDLKGHEKLSFLKVDIDEDFKSFKKNIVDNYTMLVKVNLIIELYETNFSSRVALTTANGRLQSDFFSKKESYLLEYFNVLKKLLNQIEKVKIFQSKKIYIPTLRTAHSLFRLEKFEESKIGKIDKDGINITNSKNKKIREDFFLNTVRKNYKKLNSNVEIFTGLSLYNEIVNVRNSIKEERTKFHDFETFLSINFFEGDDVDIVAKFNINNSDNGIEDDDLIKIYIGGKSRELHNLGDGIQSLIILMYKIFLAENNSMIFIDEPELNLHPGYQRLFLEQITSNIVLTKKNLTYVIVTHSNHFLDLTLEKDNVSIYSFNSFQKDKEQKFIINNVNAGDNQILRDIGVNNSSVFLANSSIWVEGISDRNFIKAFLLAYCDEKVKPKPREDIDFAFFEYAGSNLAHYNFKKGTNDYNEIKDLITSYALNNNIFLVSDLDFGKEAKHKNIQDIAKSTKGFEYKTTKPYREIENMLSDSVWEKVLINFCNKKDLKTNKENIQKRIKDSISKVKSKDYKGKYIGEFLRDLKITEMNSIYKIDDKKEPGTFIPKAELSQIVLEKVRSNDIKWEDFSDNETIVDLTKSIYDFIQKAKN